MLKYQQKQMENENDYKHNIQPNMRYGKQNQHVSIILMEWLGLRCAGLARPWPGWLGWRGWLAGLVWAGLGLLSVWQSEDDPNTMSLLPHKTITYL